MLSENISQKILQKLSLLQQSKALILKIGCEVFLVLSGRKNKAQKEAHALQYRTEVCDFEHIPEALRGVKILFLTDAHIGGNIDIIATEISTQIHVLLDGADPHKTIILHGGDFVCSASGGGETSADNYRAVSGQLFR
jgi:predicted MPP superfamily phosphohydrolase